MNLQELDWQTVVALLIVLSAVAVLAKKTWKLVFRTTTTGCGSGCHACPAALPDRPAKLTPLVQLGPPAQHRD